MFILILTLVLPIPRYPVVDGCNANSGVCYLEWDKGRPIKCSVQDARPAIALSWLSRTTEGDIPLINETEYADQRVTSTGSVSITSSSISSPYLILLVCKADDKLNLLTQDESTVLLHEKDRETQHTETDVVSVERNTKVQLKCTDANYEFLVWERVSPEGVTISPVAFTTVVTEDEFIASEEYQLLEGTLVIPEAQVHHQGSYRCTYGDGKMGGIKNVNLTVYGKFKSYVISFHAMNLKILSFYVSYVTKQHVL